MRHLYVNVEIEYTLQVQSFNETGLEFKPKKKNFFFEIFYVSSPHHRGFRGA